MKGCLRLVLCQVSATDLLQDCAKIGWGNDQAR
jgi:hypothetical protein